MPKLYVGLFLIFSTQSPTVAIKNLEAGLQKVNERLPYIQGRVFATEGNTEGRGRLAVKWSAADKNIQLRKACVEGLGARSLSGMSYEKLRDENAPLHYFPANLSPLSAWRHLQPNTSCGQDVPVLAANYTLLDGGVVIGLCIHHGVMDGAGIAEFIRFWANCTRCGNVSGMPAPDPDEPLHRDRLLQLATCRAPDGKAEPDRENETRPRKRSFRKLFTRHPEFTLQSDLTATAGLPLPPPSPMGWSKMFAFDVSKLDAIKTSLQYETSEQITTNTILSALVWSCITHVRATRREGGLGALSSKLGFTINGRTRLPRGGALTDSPFLGNVVLYGLSEMTVVELERVGLACHAVADSGFSDLGMANRDSPLAPVAREISNAINRVTQEHIAEVVDLVDQAPDARDIGPGWNSFHAADIILTSWANMGLYQSDFGAGVGKPKFVRVPEIETDGFVIVLPRKRTSAEGGVESTEVVVAMHPEDIAALEKVWRSYLC
jgi:hypothetical protein